MKHTLTLTILLLAATGWGQTYTNYLDTLPTASNSFFVAEEFVVGPVTISTTNGVVAIDEGVTLDEASREFWETLEKVYPAMFPANDIRKLAASGRICEVFGHWYPNVWIGEHKCVLCGKVEPNWRDK